MPLTPEDHEAINTVVSKFGTAYSDTAADDIQTLLDIIERLNEEAETAYLQGPTKDNDPLLGTTEPTLSETFPELIRRAYVLNARRVDSDSYDTPF